MKKIFFFCWLSCVVCHAQQFSFKKEFQLPDSLHSPTISTEDLDNDGLLDALVSSADSKGNTFFLVIKSDTINGFSFKSAITTGLSSSVQLVKDFDQDNDLDILMSGMSGSLPSTTCLINDGEFKFHPVKVSNVMARSMAFGDLTNDGRPELVLSGFVSDKPFLSILQKKGAEWTVVHDSITVAASSIVISDFDKDSFNDFMITGVDVDGQVVTSVYSNQNYLYFKPFKITNPIDGKIALSDFNHDGSFDAVISGKNSLGMASNVTLINGGRKWISKPDSLPGLSNADYLFADLNSNGIQDTYVFNASSPATAGIVTDSKTVVDTSQPGLVHQVAGDYEHDGDLDVFSIVSSGGIWKLAVHTNGSSANKGPGKPPLILTAKIFNRIFLYWERPLDDHTPADLITYDISLQGDNEDVMLGEFDLVNRKRTTVSSGNHGTKNYSLLKSNLNSYAITIQSIDNAFHTGGIGLCSGSSLCTGLENVVVEACRNERITFKEPHALWFSFSGGLLSTSVDEFVYQPSRRDTIFSVTPDGSGGCPKIKLYTVVIREKLVRKTETTKYVCADKSYRFDAEAGWAQIDWSSANRGFLSHEVSVDYKATTPDTLKVKLMNGEGCILQRNTILRLSVPDVKVEADAYQILRGQEVRLKATGASSYAWTPADGLNDVAIANPVAAPLHSTVYSVTGTDSIGCLGTASVKILVEGTAFVPNLFTPNEDGQNDDLRVYGLEEVKNFSFVIHNREGNVVYETQSIQQASNAGWDGTSKGVKQPNGVYYWKVKGQQPTGRPLQLNGKTSGAIVLIR